MLVYSHMMKTAGTSLSKSLIRAYGLNMHIIPGGVDMDGFLDDPDALIKLEHKHPFKLKCIVSHRIRPYLDYKSKDNNLQWITFFRNPQKRFVSHYFYTKKNTENFEYTRWKSQMKDTSIAEWSRVGDFSNYQTRFIAGEANFDKAVEILENKFAFIGLTESLDDYIYLLNQQFKDLPQPILPYNKELNRNPQNSPNSNTGKGEKKEVVAAFRDFIEEQNEVDIKLYKYVTDRLAQNQNKIMPKGFGEQTSFQSFQSFLNELLFFTTRSVYHQPSKINLENLKRFYKRWY